jgi:DNA mismatch repair protein MutL
MPDIIHLLPDSVANQIAAGEVIQRPASAVKEMLENAVDSGADEITLVIKDSGKTLIQVIDNGCGMSVTDARMSFERHATSKIKTANDLFAIRTLGFRGEALASIAAIAQTELKTKRVEDELGTVLVIEGSEVKSQEPCACQDGTSISVKNLFYNIPARRKFLKGGTTELRHIIEEFQRVALVNPGIKFSFINENRQLFVLAKSNLKQRIAGILGQAYNNRLVPVEQDSTIVSISGFIGKPEFAKKTRGDQYFFVNGRFIRHPYFNHAVESAFRELIPSDAFPTYFIYLSIDPGEIDINIHPTKTEINFQNGQVIYAMISSAVKQGLGKFNLVQSIDFDQEQSIQFSFPQTDQAVKPPAIKINPDYNPFESFRQKSSGFQGGNKERNKTEGWEKMYETNKDQPFGRPLEMESSTKGQEKLITRDENETVPAEVIFQLRNMFIVSAIKSGLMVVDQKRAFERIFFEGFMISFDAGKGMSQQQLFPMTLQFSPGDIMVLKGILPELRILGFDLEEFGQNTFIVNGIPVDLNNPSVNDVLENIIENFKKNQQDLISDKKINLARSLAVQMAANKEKKLEREEMISVIDRLFACKVPEVSPDGKPVVKILSFDEIGQLFKY